MKRVNNFENENCKKQKTENNDIDDMWGEDLDLSDLDDCFKLASQVYENDGIICTQRNNVTLLPSYSVFKEPKFTSTQLPKSNNIALTSVPKNNYKTTKELEMEIESLQEQVQMKVGEVSILRQQLKETKAKTETDIAKKQNEWSEKLKTTTKQMNTIKSELDFKNLEIANLKQKLNEVIKHSIDQPSTSKQTPKISAPVVAVKEQMQNIKLTPIPEPIYPLKKRIPSVIFNLPKQEKYLFNIKQKLLKNKSNFMQILQIQPEVTMLKQKSLDLSFMYNEISILTNCTLEEIQNDFNCSVIKKTLCVSLQLLHNLYSYLCELEVVSKTEDIQKNDMEYLKNGMDDVEMDVSVFDGRELCDNELGIRARQSVAFLAELLPFSSFLEHFLLDGIKINFNETDDYLSNIPCIMENEITNVKYWELLIIIVEVIGKIRLSYNCTGFLCAVTNLLCKTTETKKHQQVQDYVLKLTKKIIYSRPNARVLYIISLFLSKSEYLYPHLCNKKHSNSFKTNYTKEGILYYNEDSCVILVFVMLYQDCVHKMKNLSIQVKANENVLSFIYNLFSMNEIWIYYQEECRCDCLSKIVKLGIAVIYQTLNKCIDDKVMLKKLSDIFKLGVKVLHIISFKCYGLIEKYITVYSQYKFIINTLIDKCNEINLNKKEVDVLKELTVMEEIPIIGEKKWSKIQLLN